MCIVILAILLIFLFSLCLGLVMFYRPCLAIEIQRRFYEKINWRIEPVSMEKEIRNTRLMGLFLSALSLAIMIYILIK